MDVTMMIDDDDPAAAEFEVPHLQTVTMTCEAHEADGHHASQPLPISPSSVMPSKKTW